MGEGGCAAGGGRLTCRLVYLMNDAVESFLVFQNARMCGTYQEKFDGELSAALATEKDGYVLAGSSGDECIYLIFYRNGIGSAPV